MKERESISMFRKMRRFKQELSKEECMEILKNEPRGVLSVLGDDGYPYGMPVTHWYNEKNGKIYFHGASEGHKFDSIKNNPKVSFCVISQDKIIPEKYTTAYESVVVFGNAKIMDDKEEIKKVIYDFAKKFHPTDTEENRMFNINSDIKTMAMVEITPEHITGKEGLELYKKRIK